MALGSAFSSCIVLNEHVPPLPSHSAEGVTAGPSLGPGHRLLGEVRSLPAGGEVILDLAIFSKVQCCNLLGLLKFFCASELRLLSASNSLSSSLILVSILAMAFFPPFKALVSASSTLV